ncbi:signal peptide protein, YSIRK family, partial [Helicobacter pylori GAM265BSii]
MKKSFKKLGFVSLAASSVLLGSMNATDLETYAALQKSSHVFGNYAKKSNKGSELSSDLPTQQQAQNTASSDSQEATTLENTASSGTPDSSTLPTKETPPATSGGTGGEHHTASSGTPDSST